MLSKEQVTELRGSIVEGPANCIPWSLLSQLVDAAETLAGAKHIAIGTEDGLYEYPMPLSVALHPGDRVVILRAERKEQNP